MAVKVANDSLTVLVKPNPITPAMSYNGPLCTEDNLQLTADTLANASYAWTGPGGFSQNIQNPVRMQCQLQPCLVHTTFR